MDNKETKTDERSPIEILSTRATNWIGSTQSLAVHTILFILAFIAPLFGFDFEKTMIVLTTAVSLEAIYLAIFIQMTVNRNTESLEEVEEDIDELQEDVDEIMEEVDEIMEEEKQNDITDQETNKLLGGIQLKLESLLQDIERIKKK